MDSGVEGGQGESNEKVGIIVAKEEQGLFLKNVGLCHHMLQDPSNPLAL